MKNLIVIISALSTITLYGCAIMPQTADEVRKVVKSETFEVNRPFRDVAETFQKNASACLDMTVKVTETSGMSSRTVVFTYKPTVHVSEKKLELHVQRHVGGGGIINIYKEPEGGHYIVIADATPLDKKRTKIDMYRLVMGNSVLVKAIKGWATGENPGCPDLTKN